MPEKIWKNFVLQLLGILDKDFTPIIGPRNEFFILVFLKIGGNVPPGCDAI